MTTVTCSAPAIMTTTSPTTLSLSVDDDDEPRVAVAILIPSFDDDGAHTQLSDGSSPTPTFPDDHDIQLHRIGVSTSKYTLFLFHFFIFFFSLSQLCPMAPRSLAGDDDDHSSPPFPPTKTTL